VQCDTAGIAHALRGSGQSNDLHSNSVSKASRITGAIRKTVPALERQVRGTGEKRVSIGLWETRGERDLGFRETPSGRHLVSFVEPAERLPNVIECQLRKLLDRSASSALAR
jgi:hypothetical protein